MRDDERPAERSFAETSGLARRLRLAVAALLWERAWPALWPAVAVVGIFLALALFDLPAQLPAWLHALLLAVTAGALAAALLFAVQQLRWPGREAARRRVEKASGLAHRPLAALEDRLAGGAGDPATAGLWQLHQARMAAAARRLKVGTPAAGLVRQDPFALRIALGLVLLVGALYAGQDWSDRILRSLTPSFAPTGPVAAIGLDIWVTPPDYTGLPPQFLHANASTTAPISVPVGSTVLAQVHGGHNAPRLEIDNHATDFSRIDESNFKGGATITAGKRLAVVQDGRTLGAWPISVIPDEPPAVGFAKPPQGSERAALRLEYQAKDDYGVEGVKALIRRPGDTSGRTLTLDLPLPGQHVKDAHEASYHDLTADPWAGVPVEIQLQATDAVGQIGKSEIVETTLPERVFHNPVARAIVEQRKELTLHPDERQVVGETLSDLSLQPGLYNNDIVVFLALRQAQARLALDPSSEAIPSVQKLLWQTALRIEDGRSTLSQRDLRQSMQALQDALARNAPDAEIERLMRQVQQAMDRYLKALAENMQRQGNQQAMQPVDPSRLLSRQDLQHLLDRARELARTGARDQARNLLAQLQEMLENLRTARPMQMQGGQGQSLRAMQDMMRRQQQLLDRSFRQSRQGQRGQQGQQGEWQQGSQGDANQQEALRRMLGEMMRQLGEQGGQIPQSLGQAERAMRDAAGALRRNEPGQAINPQSQALDSLQQAARAMAEQMLGRNGGQPGDQPGLPQARRDPFGRLTTEQERGNGGIDDGGQMRMGKSQNDYALEKAKEILQELRQRAGERDRPEIERDYIDRLLKQF